MLIKFHIISTVKTVFHSPKRYKRWLQKHRSIIIIIYTVVHILSNMFRRRLTFIIYFVIL